MNQGNSFAFYQKPGRSRTPWFFCAHRLASVCKHGRTSCEMRPLLYTNRGLPIQSVGGSLMKLQLSVYVAIVFVLTSCIGSFSEASELYRVVAANGQLTGIGNGTFDGFFWGASFDPAGRINLRADSTTAHGVWIEQSGSLVPSLGTPGVAPGFPTGASVEHLYKGGAIALNGYSTAIGYVSGGGVTGFPRALFASGPDGTFRLAARTGQPAYNMPGVTVSVQGGPDFLSNRNSDLLVQGGYIGGPFSETGTQAIWLERGLGPELAFYSGMPAPGFPSGVTLQTMASKLGVAIDDDQRIAYGGTAGTSRAIWLFDPNASVAHRLVAKTESASTVPTFSNLGELQLTKNRVVFRAVVNAPGTTASAALLSETNGSLETIAQVGAVAPGLGPDDIFDHNTAFDVERVAVNGRGDIAFAAITHDRVATSKRTQGIWLDSLDAEPKLVLQSSDLPDSPSLAFLGSLVMNDGGQMAFTTRASDLRDSLWFYDQQSGGQRIAAEGDVVSLTLNGQLVSRTIDQLQVGSFQNEHLAASRYLSESGQVIFVAVFREGGSAALSWSPVPEPCSLLLLAAGTTFRFRSRRLRSRATKLILAVPNSGDKPSRSGGSWINP